MMNRWDIPLILWWITVSIMVVSMVSVCNAETIEYNGTNSWAGTSGTMLEHGDGNLRNPPNVTIGLISYWNPGTDIGSGTILTDIWGNNDGTIHGATWNMTSGMLEYDGVDDYVDCGNDASLDTAVTDTVSLFAEIKPTDVTGNHRAIITKYPGFRYYQFTSDIQGKIGGKTACAAGVLTAGVGSHVTMTYDKNLGSDNIKIFVDGTQRAQENQTIVVPTSQNPVMIGGDGVSGDFWMSGSVGPAFIYNICPTNTQINETRDNYHTITSYRQVDINDYGAGRVLKYINVTGIDYSVNTTITVYIDGGNGWEHINGSHNVGDNITVPETQEYRYATVKIVSNTTYQPETNIISGIILTSGKSGNKTVTLEDIYQKLETIEDIHDAKEDDIMELTQILILIALIYINHISKKKNLLLVVASVTYVTYLTVYVNVNENMALIGFYILIIAYFVLSLLPQKGGKK